MTAAERRAALLVEAGESPSLSDRIALALLVEMTELRADLARRMGERKAAPVRATATPSTAPVDSGAIATDAEMDGQYGNKPIYRDPPRWTGASFKGIPLSDCPADYLDEMASFCDWKIAQPPLPGKEANVKYAVADARLARGWAARVRALHPSTRAGDEAARSGGQSGDAPGAPAVGGEPEDDIPFLTMEGAR